MQYRQLGRSGLKISPICLGTMMFGGPTDAATSSRIIAKAREAGINFIDTADAYSSGGSEQVVGRAIANNRDSWILATKLANPMGDDPNRGGLSRRWVLQAAEESLKRLGTDYIDLYQIHRFDPLTHLEDTLRALDDLVHAGKVRYIGCSNLAAWQVMKALAISREQRLERFRCTQSFYSLAGRELEREMIPLLKDQGLGLLVWSPLAGGFLSGKFTRTGGDQTARRANFDFPPVDKEKGFEILDVLTDVARARAASVAQVALAWVLAQDAVTSVIIGARKLSQLDDNLQSIDLTLSADELKALDDVSRLTPEYPEWMNRLPSDRRPGEERRLVRDA
jgi:aryl-alcohol dehydrogenase-like predicted oxidoreductase